MPPAEGVANYLYQHFDESLAPLLGVYLIKLGDVWPNWQTMGVILYLGRLSSPIAIDVLLRFATRTPNEHYRAVASQSLVSIGNASVLNTLQNRIKQLEAQREQLRQIAQQIRDKLNPMSERR